jgi:hypothetical protein
MPRKPADKAGSSRPETRLELHVQEFEGGVAAATVPVRWCVTKELIESITARNFVKPVLVLVVRSLGEDTFLGETRAVWTETSARVVPLVNELEFVSFRRPGTNELRAVIVDADGEEAIKQLDKIRKGKAYGSVFEGDGSLEYGNIAGRLKYIELNSQLTVEVDEKLFAPPPSPRRMKLVRRFFSGSEVDQCHLRERTTASIFAAIMLLTFGQLLKVLQAIGLLLFGIRDIPWGEFAHPWEGRVDDLLNNCDGSSIWFHDERGNARLSPLWLINPIVLLLVPNATYGVLQLIAHSHHGKGAKAYLHSFPGYWGTVWRVDLAIVALAVVITVVVAILVLIDEALSKYSSSQSRMSKRAQERKLREIEEQTKLARELQAMTCDIASSAVSLSALPEGKVTVHLRFMDLKSKVCKPFAR